MTTSPANEGFPRWAPDGKWVYFGSNRSGAAQVWKIPPEGGQAVQITKGGGRAPTPSSDGRVLYYAKGPPGSRSVWRVPAEGGEEIPVFDALNSHSQFAVVERGIYFVSTPDRKGRRFLQRFDFASRRIRQIAEMPGEPGLGLSVSPDGRYILYTQVGPRGSDLMLAENFR